MTHKTKERPSTNTHMYTSNNDNLIQYIETKKDITLQATNFQEAVLM